MPARATGCMLMAIATACSREPPPPPHPPPVEPVIRSSTRVADSTRVAPVTPVLDAAVGDAAADGATEADGGTGDAGPPSYDEIQADPARFPLHAIATSLETRILLAPRDQGDRIGYLRMGARMRVGPPVRGGGCGGAWHEIAGGGFVCTSDGLIVSEEPLERRGLPPPPCLDCPLPYQYGFTRFAHTPMLGRLPDAEETRVIDDLIAQREHGPLAPTSTRDGGAGAAATVGALAGGTGADGGPEPRAEVIARAVEGDATEAPVSGTEQRLAPSVVTWLERGFFVSINRLIGAKNRRLYFKTIKGRYVAENRVFRFPGFSPWRGVRPDADHPLPVWFVKSTRAVMEPGAGTAGLERAPVDRLTRLDVVGETGRQYRLASGHVIDKAFVARVALSPTPPGLNVGEKWIDVDLSEQTLVAYEGEQPVLATMVSTGREDFETPRGDFRVKSKHVATTMDGNTASDGPYSIEDVPWTMYFHRSYALHGAFWHRQYGIARSHGCVNLSAADAQFLFQWTTPALPAGWHGVHASRERPGTRVIVHE